jgi:oligopeptidase A
MLDDVINLDLNALLDFTGLPQFDRFQPELVGPAIEQLLQDARAAVERAQNDPAEPRWETLIAPLETATERLARAWNMVGHLNHVDDSPSLREAYNAALPKVTEFWTELGQNRQLYSRTKALAAAAGWAHSDPEIARERQRAIEHSLRSFRLGGAELEGDQRTRFASIAERLAELSQKFSENVLDATNAELTFVQTQAELDGLPADVCDEARAEAEKAGKPGWAFSLRMPSYLPVMQYAKNRALRERMYRAYVTRASDLGPAEKNNAPLIAEILALRGEEAALLGFDNYAQLSLEPKMAESPEQVVTFLRDMARRARPFAERDLADIREFAQRELAMPALEAWDIAFVSERLKEARYSFSDQEVKRYFQAPRVLEGLFGVIQRLFGVTIRRDEAPVWHPDVSFWRVERASVNNSEPSSNLGSALDSALVGQFYVDLYARSTKRGGAWMDNARNRWLRPEGHLQTPVAYLNCNGQPPIGDRPGLMTHDDVITLFHEFGHGLHHLLTRVSTSDVAGINGVEWDAVELPSQFMENFCWEWDVVQAMSAEVDSGEPLPKALFDRMVAAKNYQAGLQTLRQVEFSLFDMQLHAATSKSHAPDVRALIQSVRDEVAVIVPPAFNRFENTFAHIFAGGYAAGYYSYKWAEVLSADCFAAFEEAATGPVDSLVGKRFLDEILSVGGSRPAIESFRSFRGRDPSIDALLRHQGMAENSALAA